MLKLNFKTLFIVLSSKVLNDGNISKYSSSIGNILIKCITNDNTFEDEKMYLDFLNLNLNGANNCNKDTKNKDNVVDYKDKLRKYIVSIDDTNVWYVLAYFGVLAKVDEIYHLFEKQIDAEALLDNVLDKYCSKLKDIEGRISLYNSYIYLLTSALLSVIFDEAICKNLCFSKATRLVLSEPIQDTIQKVNKKLNTYINLC